MTTLAFGPPPADVWPRQAAADARPTGRPGGREVAPVSFALLLGFLGLLFASLPLVLPSVARFAPAHAIAAAALGMVFLERTAARQPLRLVWPDTHLLFGFVAVAGLSCFTALWSGFAVENTLLLLRYLAIYLLIVNTAGSLRRLRVLYGVFAFGGLIPALGALQNMRAGHLVEGRVGWVGIFSNPNDLAYTLAVLFPLALSLALVTRSLLLKLALGGVMAVYALTVYLCYSRGGLLGFGVVVLLAVLRWSRPWLLIPAALVGAAVLVVGMPMHWNRSQGFADLGHDTTVRQRLSTITAGLRMLADRPLLGVGPGCSEVGWKRYSPDATLAPGTLHTHNTFVQVLAETGLLGGAFFYLLLGSGLRKAQRAGRAWKRWGDRDAHRVVSALEIALWGLCVCGLSGGYVLSWFPYLLFGLVAAAWTITVEAGARLTARLADAETFTPLPGDIPCAASPAS